MVVITRKKLSELAKRKKYALKYHGDKTIGNKKYELWALLTPRRKIYQWYHIRKK